MLPLFGYYSISLLHGPSLTSGILGHVYSLVSTVMSCFDVPFWTQPKPKWSQESRADSPDLQRNCDKNWRPLRKTPGAASTRERDVDLVSETAQKHVLRRLGDLVGDMQKT